jgi:hypothetical protein
MEATGPENMATLSTGSGRRWTRAGDLQTTIKGSHRGTSAFCIARGEETLETKPPWMYMTFKELQQHSLMRLKELSLGARPADLVFKEDAQQRADSGTASRRMLADS